MSGSDTETNTPAPAPEENIQFNTEIDVEAELEEMRRQVDSLQEDLQLKTLQESAAKDEGTRKTALSTTAGTAAGGKPANTSVFVGALDARTTEADLRVFFGGCGAITRVTVLKDHYTQQPKGTAYIEFETPEQAQAALLKDNQSMHGKPIKVAPKRENVPAFQRGAPRGAGGPVPGLFGRGRGAAGAANPMQQQMAAMAMMATMMSGGMGFSPFGGAPRGRGRGRGRGSH